MGLGIISVFSHPVASAFLDGNLVLVLPNFERQTLPVRLVGTSRGVSDGKLAQRSGPRSGCEGGI
jgi:hypothetical protein